MSLANKKIILGISGSIAAYKSATLVRFLIKKSCEVRVIMTDHAQDFISSLTLSTLSHHKVYTDMFADGVWANHVELGLWADAMIIAPCTATTLSKLANGHADNMLVASYLSAKCPVFIAPAMDLDMWKHGSTIQNLEKVKEYGNQIIPVGHGELASGLVGDGRMAEPEEIVSFLEAHFQNTQDLIGKKVMITAGPTIESLDPVRFISNHSTGKMGIALANECLSRGANVTLVLGPSNIKPDPEVALVPVRSAQEMYNACATRFDATDITILAAAVADYTPITTAAEKIKKKDGDLSIPLKRTIDIAATFGEIKKDGQITIGFALETQNELENAKSKRKRKNFDFIVLNSMKEKGAGFKSDTNKVTIIHKNDQIKEYPLKSKTKVAIDIVNEIVTLF